MSHVLEAEYAMSIQNDEARDPRNLGSVWQWTGWTRRLWPANIEWVGRRVYAFDKINRRFCALLRITHGEAFEYRTKKEYERNVEVLCEQPPDFDDPHAAQMPFSRAGGPYTGFALKWTVVKVVDIPYNIPRFPRNGWLRIPEAGEFTNHLDVADLYEEGGDPVLRQHREFERNGPLRRAARLYWQGKFNGLRCLACNFSFKEYYGVEDFIEMHHERWLSRERGKRKKTVVELVPVCSNCHRMLHRYAKNPLSIGDLRRLLGRQMRKRKSQNRSWRMRNGRWVPASSDPPLSASGRLIPVDGQTGDTKQDKQKP